MLPSVAFMVLGVSSSLLAFGMPRCPDKLQQLSVPNCGADDPECPLEAPFHAVNISVDEFFRYVQTSYCPPYDWSCVSNQHGRRPCARQQTFKIPLNPRPTADPILLGLGWQAGKALDYVALNDGRPMLGPIGVLVNGVALNGVATKLSEALPAGVKLEGPDRWVDAVHAEAWMDDDCLGHLSGGGNYHTHAGRWSPQQLQACGLPQEHEGGRHSALIGWAFDGHGLYGPQDGIAPHGDLDLCGGHVGVTDSGTLEYHYHFVKAYPYALECYRACPEPSNNFRFTSLACVQMHQQEL